MRPFIYHIRPRVYAPSLFVKLLEFRIASLGIHLRGNDLRTGRPYPNKGYDVGHRRIGRKHVDGILLALSDWPPIFETEALWSINAEYISRHRVTYTLLDKEFDAASDDMCLWGAAVKVNDDWMKAADKRKAFNETPTQFQDRWPEWAKGITPVKAEPCLRIFPDELEERHHLNIAGQMVEQNDSFSLPTIEPERILGPDYPREAIPLPTLDMAIKL